MQPEQSLLAAMGRAISITAPIRSSTYARESDATSSDQATAHSAPSADARRELTDDLAALLAGRDAHQYRLLVRQPVRVCVAFE